MVERDQSLRINPLSQAIENKIGESGPISFAQFMHYWNRGIDENGQHTPGYYEKYAKIGNDSADFTTSPEISPVFGYLLARQAILVWQSMGSPEEFRIVEMGAGNGTLARDLLHGVAYYNQQLGLDFTPKYTIVENSSVLLQNQRETVREFEVDFVESDATQVNVPPFEGMVLTNELLDDLPVHPLRRVEGVWEELFIDEGDETTFTERWLPISDEVRSSLSSYTPQVADGQVYYYSPGSQNWLANVAGMLKRGAVVTIDYSQPEVGLKLYPAGENKSHSPLDKRTVGLTNITTGVDFDLLHFTGRQVGLNTARHSTQGDLLSSLGFYGSRTDLQIHFLCHIPPEDLRRRRAARHSGIYEDFLVSDRYRALIQTTPGFIIPQTV